MKIQWPPENPLLIHDSGFQSLHRSADPNHGRYHPGLPALRENRPPLQLHPASETLTLFRAAWIPPGGPENFVASTLGAGHWFGYHEC
jgi:hypothetical protein